MAGEERPFVLGEEMHAYISRKTLNKAEAELGETKSSLILRGGVF